MAHKIVDLSVLWLDFVFIDPLFCQKRDLETFHKKRLMTIHPINL